MMAWALACLAKFRVYKKELIVVCLLLAITVILQLIVVVCQTTNMFILILFLISSSITAFLALNNLGPIVISTKLSQLDFVSHFLFIFTHSIIEAYSIHKRDSKIKHGKVISLI